MQVKGTTIISALFGICILIFLFSFQKTDPTARKLQMLATQNGLKNVKVVSETDDIWSTYIINSKNFENLSFDEMLELDGELSACGDDLKYKCNGNVYICNYEERIVEKNGNEVYNDYENSSVYREKKEKEEERASYIDKFPYIGMREEFLPYTILGKPNKIEKCKNFDSLRSNRKYKTYIWYETEEHGRWDVTVGYAELISHDVGYKEYPTSNGVVAYMSYNEKGKSPVTIYE